jgi:hypothetical protein
MAESRSTIGGRLWAIDVKSCNITFIQLSNLDFSFALVAKHRR